MFIVKESFTVRYLFKNSLIHSHMFSEYLSLFMFLQQCFALAATYKAVSLLFNVITDCCVWLYGIDIMFSFYETHKGEYGIHVSLIAIVITDL